MKEQKEILNACTLNNYVKSQKNSFTAHHRHWHMKIINNQRIKYSLNGAEICKKASTRKELNKNGWTFYGHILSKSRNQDLIFPTKFAPPYFKFRQLSLQILRFHQKQNWKEIREQQQIKRTSHVTVKSKREIKEKDKMTQSMQFQLSSLSSYSGFLKQSKNLCEKRTILEEQVWMTR